MRRSPLPFALIFSSAATSLAVAFLSLSAFAALADEEAGNAVAKISATQRIDEFIDKSLVENGVEAYPAASDEIFVRRIYLDIAGRIPTRAETLAFLGDKAAGKRNRLIGGLLDSEAYVQNFTNYWSDLLRAKTRISGNGNSMDAGRAYTEWIRDALGKNMPYDEMARQLVSSHGRTWENGAIGYYLRDYGMQLDNLALTSQVFLGTQIVCAQCHNHPFDEWTQMDYFKMAAFTYGTIGTNDSENSRAALELFEQRQKQARKAGGTPSDFDARELRKALSEVLFPVRYSTVARTGRLPRLPHDYQYDDAKPKAVIRPETPFEPVIALDLRKDGENDQTQDPSEIFAEWLTSPENPRFTKVIVNRLWKKVMVYGLIEPADELRADTAASHPELLAFLEKRFVALDYDMKRFLGILYNTKTYQRESHTEDVTPGIPYYFPGPLLRRMSAEQIWDSMVAMIVEDPDARSPEQKLFRDRQMVKTEWIGRAIYGLSPEEMLDGALEVASYQKVLAEQIQQTQIDLTAARDDGDAEKIRAAQDAVAEIRRQLQERIAERIYRHGLQQKIELVSASAGARAAEDARDPAEANFLQELTALLERKPNFLAEAGLTGGKSDVPPLGSADAMTTMMDGETGMSKSRTKGPGYGGTLMDDVVLMVLAEPIAGLRRHQAESRELQLQAWGVNSEDERKAFDRFAENASKLIRAAELPSPAPNGHFLREFGQSDREVIDNGNDQASITQALELLNGAVINGLASPYSVVRRDLSGAEDSKEMIRIIYQTMLSREPDAEEMKLLLAARREDKNSPVSVIWALINTRQFLFIQ